jgi:hypothetical protein
MLTKKTIILIAALFVTGIVIGTQTVKTIPMHFMDGHLMTDHDMPVSDCNDKECFMVPETANLMQLTSLPILNTKDFTSIKSILAVMLLVSLAVLINRKNSFNFFQNAPPHGAALSTVVLRE